MNSQLNVMSAKFYISVSSPTRPNELPEIYQQKSYKRLNAIQPNIAEFSHKFRAILDFANQ